jgi:8-oxo-dGTP pyrophosphatase MutT (NUDIX family)
VQYREIGSQREFTTKWFSIDRHDYAFADGTVRPYYRLVKPDFVLIAAADASDRLALVNLSRPPLGGMSLEFPQGGIEPGEDLLAAARRELLEETGIEPGELRHIGSFYETAGLSSCRCHVVMGKLIGQTTARPDAFEAGLELRWLPRDMLGRMVVSGEIRDGATISALTYLSVLQQGTG